MSKILPIGNRVMDKAYLRDGDVIHRGEALLLALLVHTKGNKKRKAEDVKQIAAMLDDPNIDKKRRPRRK